MEEANHQYGYECAIRRRVSSTNLSHISKEERRHVFSMDASVQYGGGTPSVRMQVCSMDPSHRQHSGGCGVRISHIISTVEGVL